MIVADVNLLSLWLLLSRLLSLLLLLLSLSLLSLWLLLLLLFVVVGVAAVIVRYYCCCCSLSSSHLPYSASSLPTEEKIELVRTTLITASMWQVLFRCYQLVHEQLLLLKQNRNNHVNNCQQLTRTTAITISRTTSTISITTSSIPIFPFLIR